MDLARLLPLIGPASAALARFDGVLSAVPNANVLLSPLTTQEAVLSSKIEGTQATLGEVLEFEAGDESQSESKRADIVEILNYRAAMHGAVKAMQTLPLSQRVLRKAHRTLMQGVRGRNKSPGEYRKGSNWIGPEGSPVEMARFVPPGADRVPVAMSAWEKFLHADASDRLIQLSVLHAEFEAIHPFWDGNGRLGRLLVPLFLVDKGILSKPTFYISAYLEAHREEYYDRLLRVSRDDDWTGWCEFFLTAIREQAKANHAKGKAILDLHARLKEEIVELTHSQYATKALDWFFSRPIFALKTFVETSGIPEPTARRIAKLATDDGILKVIRMGSGRRSTRFRFPALLDITERDKTE